MNEFILKINQTHDIFEADILHAELRIGLDILSGLPTWTTKINE